MDLENIKRVEETPSIEILNLYLDNGWVLIATASPQGSRTYYTVGWKEEIAPIYPEFIKSWRNKELPNDLYGDFMTEENAFYFYTKYQEN
jgi:hypothetical protein